jgi:hypothetical protein
MAYGVSSVGSGRIQFGSGITDSEARDPVPHLGFGSVFRG